jgi:large subunit ribosomal protein L37Ae
MEVSQHSKFFCEFCGKVYILYNVMLLKCLVLMMINYSLQYAVKRKAVGIWGCKDCGKMKAWGAYTLK